MTRRAQTRRHSATSARGLTRRDLLRSGAALTAAAALPGSLLASAAMPAAPLLLPGAPLPGARQTKRIVLVVFGGGVRSRETLGSGNTPALDRMAAEGTVFPRTSVRNNGHYGSTVNIFTGTNESYGIRENGRPIHPTLFEYVRAGAGLPPSEVWLSTAGSDQETNYAYSAHDRYGADYGANLIGGEGIFNAELVDVMGGRQALGSANADVERQMAALRGSVRTPLVVDGAAGVANDPEASGRIERYLLEELRGDTARLTGLGANDAKSLRVARNLMGIFRPRLMAVTLRNADVAHQSINDYVTVIRRCDEELGQLFDTIRNDEELASSTAIFVLPEFGRDRDLNMRRGLDHGDGSEDLLNVNLVAWGPDFRKGKVQSREIESIDVSVTIASMFGVKSPVARGSVISGLMA